MRLSAVVLLAVMWAAPGAAQSDAIVGIWSGSLQVQPGMQLPLVLHIRSEAGQLRGALDSPAQGAMGIPVDSVRFEDGTITVRMLAINATYSGRLTGPDVLAGEWRQGAGALPLELRRSDTPPPGAARPQHPVPPFPYRSEEVRIRNDAAGIELAGTLTLPPGPGPFPGAVLVSGSGPQDRDETLMGHKPFLVLSDYLTRAGIAVLRYDDRGVGGSGGDFAAATTMDFAGDAAAAITHLQAHPEVDGTRVGVIGHSEGGLIAPLVAAGAHGLPAAAPGWLVLLAGPALPGGEILLLQSAALSRAAGATAAQQDAARRFQLQMQEIIRAEAEGARRRDRLRAGLRQALDDMPPEERLAQGVPPDQEARWIDAQVGTLSTEWFRHFVLLDPRPVLRQVDVPVLALFGERDLQVPSQENMAAMREALAGNTDVTIVEMPRLNHLFQTATTGGPAEYAQIEETFAPAALERIAQWILLRFSAAAGKE